MSEKINNSETIVKNWLESAEQNFKTLEHMLDSKDYSWALFLGHLVIEKSLKAVYVSRLHKHAIFSHDLLRLASKTGIELTEEQQEWLDEITTFNLNARYDNYKQDFNNRCTKEFTEIWIERIKTLKEW